MIIIIIYAPCLPPKFCITNVFDFSWDDWNTQEGEGGLNKVHYGRGENGKLPTKQHGTNWCLRFISRNFEILLFSSLRPAGRHQVEESVRRFIGLNDIIVLSRHSYGLAAEFMMLIWSCKLKYV